MSETNTKTKILFLCTGNSTRSIMAEYFMNNLSIGGGKFEAVSAGVDPKGEIHPMTKRVMDEFFSIDTSDAKPKSWEQFKDENFDFVITVCDRANEECPEWPGSGDPVQAHWGSPDPAELSGSDDELFAAFRDVGLQIHRRIQIFVNLPMELDDWKVREMTRDIGQQATELSANS